MARNMLIEQRGYRYAEQLNGCLAGMAEEPSDEDYQDMKDDVDFQNGCTSFYDELDRQP